MNGYLARMLHAGIHYEPYECKHVWPHLYTRKYDFYLAYIFDIRFFVIAVKTEVPLRIIIKNLTILSEYMGLPCCLFYRDILPSVYVRKSFVKQDIPYWIEGRDVYLPFLGVILMHKPDPVIRPIVTQGNFSVAAQRFLFQVIYHRIRRCTASRAAAELGFSARTCSRIFDELKAFDASFIKDDVPRRMFVYEHSYWSLWRKIKPYLQSPVVRSYGIDNELPKPYVLAGISALAHHTMLCDDNQPTYGITIAQEREMKLSSSGHLVPAEELPEQKIRVLRYILPYKGDTSVMDPLSIIVELYAEHEETDPRVAGEIDDLLKRVLMR